MVITGCEGINAGTRPIARENDEERKPDLFIAPSPENSVAITLHAGDFAVFMPEEPHGHCAQLARLLQYAKRSLKYRATCWKPKRRENDNGNDPGIRNTGPDDRADHVGQNAFGAPPLLACLLLVVSGLSTVQQAFAGFVNPSVVMIAGFMVVMAALQKPGLSATLNLR